MIEYHPVGAIAIVLMCISLVIFIVSFNERVSQFNGTEVIGLWMPVVVIVMSLLFEPVHEYLLWEVLVAAMVIFFYTCTVRCIGHSQWLVRFGLQMTIFGVVANCVVGLTL